MQVNLENFKEIRTPIYVLEESRLRQNLSLIKSVADRADMEIILAFKAYALWKTFPIFREYISSTTASSLSEAKLAFEKFGSPAHTFSPAYTDDEIDEIARCSSHLTFNSLSQYERFHERVATVNPSIKLGLRVNPEYSEVETLLYNPCAPGSRFGVTADKLPEILPSDIEGFHCHCHCESGADVFERTLVHIEEKFGKWFSQLKWINFGGGHLMTRKDYDVLHLINIIRSFICAILIFMSSWSRVVPSDGRRDLSFLRLWMWWKTMVTKPPFWMSALLATCLIVWRCHIIRQYAMPKPSKWKI